MHKSLVIGWEEWRASRAANLELSGDEALVPPNPTFRWVNGEVEKWASAQMDAKFKRLDAKTFTRLWWGKTPPEGAVAWLLDEKVHEYFVITRSSGAWNPRQHAYILWDGKDKRAVVAAFDSFPNRKEAAGDGQGVRRADSRGKPSRAPPAHPGSAADADRGGIMIERAMGRT